MNLLESERGVIQKTGSFATTGLPSAVTGNTFNLANEMTAFNATPLAYDANGNLTNDGTNAHFTPSILAGAIAGSVSKLNSGAFRQTGGAFGCGIWIGILTAKLI